MPGDSTGPQSRQNSASEKDSPNSSSSSSNVGCTPIPEGLMEDLRSSRDALHAAASTVIMAPMHATLRALTSRNLRGSLDQIPEGLITLLSSRDALLVAASTDITAPMHAVLQALTSRDLGNLSQRLLELIQAIVRGEDLRRIFEAFGPYIAAHPEQVAGLVIGIVRGANPLALAGFGLLGLVVPAAWQASFGNVAASLSLVTFLQSVGIPNEVAVPPAGGLMVGAAAAAAALTAKSEVTRLRAKL